MLRQSKIIEPMKYRAIACLAQREPEGDLEDHSSVPVQAEFETRIRELNAKHKQLEEEFQVQLNGARKEAYEAGRKSAEDERSAMLIAASESLTKAIEEFRLSRDQYLAQVEREVVQLSLAIAERILHREAQMDPLLLSGAVRVALGQLAESTEVRLRVPIGEEQMWAEMLRLMPNLPLHPELAVDERMKIGECTIETKLGSVDIGIRAQLTEIERGFFDLLADRELVTKAARSIDG